MRQDTKKQLRHIIDRGARLRQYFLRGHSSWFALAFSLMNFTLIFYNLLFVNLYFIPEIFKSFSIFFIIFCTLYLPFAMLIGYLDYKKGTYSAEQQLTKEVSPVWREVFEKFAVLEKQNQELLNALQTKRDGK
ncbi:MAG: hypothetical protein ACTSQ9_03625 [Candidatus Hodarchaeales archaeon]